MGLDEEGTMTYTMEQKNQFAQYLSEGRSPKDAAAQIRLTGKADACHLMNAVRHELGYQAR